MVTSLWGDKASENWPEVLQRLLGSLFYEVSGGFWPLLTKGSVGKRLKISTSFGDLFPLSAADTYFSTWMTAFALSNPWRTSSSSGRFCRRALAVSPFCNSTYAVYHPTEQIPLQRHYKLICNFQLSEDASFSGCMWLSLSQTNDDYKGHQMLSPTGKPSKPPESPSPRDYSLPRLIKPLSKRLRRHEWEPRRGPLQSSVLVKLPRNTH